MGAQLSILTAGQQGRLLTRHRTCSRSKRDCPLRVGSPARSPILADRQSVVARYPTRQNPCAEVLARIMRRFVLTRTKVREMAELRILLQKTPQNWRP